uniref:Malate dehydrogenase, cytoplasmic n=1 Tax=Ascaris lumbricoides TaxID=6252 RepID=A0A0M3I6Z3_ASCLU
MSEPIRVLVTGAAGQIGYSLVLQVAKGNIFGHSTPIVLVMLDIPPTAAVLEGVKFELQDCALPNLIDVVAATDEKTAFTNIDYAFLVGAMPRKQGMERKDLLAANVKIFKSQGKALADYAKPTTKIGDVKDVIIWGNHSNTQYPDASHAKVNKGGKLLEAPAAVGDDAWLKGEFLSASFSLLCASLNLVLPIFNTVQKRGAIIIEKRKLSSAMSAAKAACDHVHDWFVGTKQVSTFRIYVCTTSRLSKEILVLYPNSPSIIFELFRFSLHL